MRNFAKIMPILKKDSQMQRVAVLLFDGFSNHCLANAIEPLRGANKLSGRDLYHWDFVSLDGQVVTSSSGLPVMPCSSLSRHGGGDFLFLMPSYGVFEQDDSLCRRGLRAARGRFKTLVGMDMGSWLLASAGLLDGHSATIHWDEITRFMETFPDLTVVPDPVVAGDSVMTCGGAMTAFDLVLDLIESHHGAMLALETRSLFSIADQRPGTPHSDPDISRSKHWDMFAVMRANVETPLKMSDLAKLLKMTQRDLEKICQARYKTTPRSLYKRARLWEARRLLSHGRYSVLEVSQRCGYADPSAMARAYKAEFGHAPSATCPN